MADVEDRRAGLAERGKEIDDPRHCVGIIAPLARRLPFVEGALRIDDDEGGVGIGHECHSRFKDNYATKARAS